MGWQLAAGLNGVIALSYFGIAGLISLGLFRTKQLTTNPLALATAAIFFTCALHHGHHGAHLLLAFGGHESPDDLAAVREVFGEWHSVAIEVLGAAVAVTYLGLRRNYRTLLNTPRMFDDRVRLAAEQSLRELAFIDSLTGIPNRAAYQSLADGFTDSEHPAVVLFLDLDGFKGINDSFGHDVGDRVLRDVAGAVAEALREDEYVFRLGGDELIVIGLAHGLAAVDDIRARVEAAVSLPVPTRDGTITVGASCGLAQGAAGDIGGLLRAADRDMYRIKTGRGATGVPGPRAPGQGVPEPPGGRVRRSNDSAPQAVQVGRNRR